MNSIQGLLITECTVKLTAFLSLLNGQGKRDGQRMPQIYNKNDKSHLNQVSVSQSETNPK